MVQQKNMEGVMKKVLSVASIISFAVVLFCVTSISSLAQEKQIRLRYSQIFPPTHPIAVLGDEWCKEIEKKTAGRIKITYFPGGTLTPPMQTYDSVVKATADIGASNMAYSPGRFLLTEVLSLPIGYTGAYQMNKLHNEYFKKFKPKEFDDVKVMFFHTAPPGLIHTTKMISSL